MENQCITERLSMAHALDSETKFSATCAFFHDVVEEWLRDPKTTIASPISTWALK